MNNKITIIVPTYKRTDLLLRDDNPILNKLNVFSDIIDKIIIIWQDIDNIPPKELYDKINNLKISVFLIISNINSLNNRFYPYDIINTNCIFSIDDDYDIDITVFEKSYNIWLENQDRIVGFAPRYIENNIYHGNADKNKDKPYNTILTGGGCFFHYKYLIKYTENNSIKNIVDKYFNGEDIAMNFIITKNSKKSPILVESESKTWVRHPIALCNKSNHGNKRLLIFKQLKNIFNDINLIKSFDRY